MIKTKTSFAVLTLVTSMALAGCANQSDRAAPTTTAPVAATTESSMTTPAAAAPRSNHVEGRIEALHAKLGITAAQEPQWSAVAETMRSNEAAIHAAIDERQANAKMQSAVDDLQSYEKIADEHAEGLKRLIPVFKTLYDTMSDAQKKNADEVFGRYEGHRDHKAHKGHKHHGHHKAKNAQ